MQNYFLFGHIKIYLYLCTLNKIYEARFVHIGRLFRQSAAGSDYAGSGVDE